MGFVGFGGHELGTELGRSLRHEVRRQHDAEAQRSEAWIAEAQAILGGGIAIPGRHDPKRIAQILRHRPGTQPVEIEAVDTSDSKRSGHVQEESAAAAGRCLGNKAVEDDFALWGQQSRKAGRSRRKFHNINRQQAVEKTPRVVAGHLDDAAIRQQRSLHPCSSNWLMIRQSFRLFGQDHVRDQRQSSGNRFARTHPARGRCSEKVGCCQAGDKGGSGRVTAMSSREQDRIKRGDCLGAGDRYCMPRPTENSPLLMRSDNRLA